MSEETIISTLPQQDPSLLDLVEECIRELPLLVSKLSEALERGDQEEASHIAHDIKGAGGSYGFQPVAEKAAQIEVLCRKGQIESAKAHLSELSSLLPRLRAKP